MQGQSSGALYHQQDRTQSLASNQTYYRPNAGPNVKAMIPQQVYQIPHQSQEYHPTILSGSYQAQSNVGLVSELDGQAPREHSSVFFGNISYDLYEQSEEELNRTLKTVGPYRDMKLMFGEDQKPKGFGFCTYNDPDIAASAIRNLNKLAINNRDLKVHFASDKMSGTNLKPEEVRHRDQSEIISTSGVSLATAAQTQSLPPCEILLPQFSSVDEMLRSLSDQQKENLIFGIQDSYNFNKLQSGKLIESLAKDEEMLVHLEEIFQNVYHKLREQYGEQNIVQKQGGLWNMQ